MANKKLWLGILTMVLAFGIAVVGCEDDSGGNKLPEQKSDAERWWTWADPTSTVTVSHSVAADGICRIVVDGTAITTYDLWKAQAGYSYTAKQGKIYTYRFEARTSGVDRYMNIQWYADNDNEVYHTEYYFPITSTWQTYTVTGSLPIPKSGEQSLQFLCANQTGTFYVKILSITESSGDNDAGDLAGTWRGTVMGSTATVTVSNSGWTLSIPGLFYADTGYFDRNGNSAILYSNSNGKNVGTANIINSNTIQIVLNFNSDAPGTYTLTRQ